MKISETDWIEAERLMGKCVRGGGYEPTESEMRLLEAALSQDLERYRRTHAAVVRQAGRELMGIEDDS